MGVRGEKRDDLHPAVATGGAADAHLDPVPFRRRTLASRRSPPPAGAFCKRFLAPAGARFQLTAPRVQLTDARARFTDLARMSTPVDEALLCPRGAGGWRPRCLAGALESVCSCRPGTRRSSPSSIAWR